jgi:hypothetical protein
VNSAFRIIVSLTILSANLWAGTPQPGYPVPHVAGPTVPQSVPPGGPDFTITVYGANFIPASTVNWNRQPRATTYISAHELQAQILAADIATPTAGMITVTTTTPNGPITSSTYFQVEVHTPEPTIGSMEASIYAHCSGDPALVGDLYNDGKLDLIGVNLNEPNDVNALINDGTGTFQLGSLLATNEYGDLAALGDFNGDGNLDYMYLAGFVKQVTPTHLEVNFGNGDGTFTPGPTFGTFGNRFGPEAPGNLVVGDYNQDGVLDVAMPWGSGQPYINLFLGNGDGTFTQQRPVHFDRTGQLATGDFNGDGILDFISLVPNDDNTEFRVKLMLGIGNGMFQPVQAVATIVGDLNPPFFVSDFNQDGNSDLAFANSNGQIGIMLGTGDGTFRAPVYYTVGLQFFFTFAVGDFNSDGKTDLIVQTNQERGDSLFEILLGNGDGTFQDPQVIPHGGFPANLITVGDFNNDGLLDFAYPSQSYYVYLQQ